MILVGGCGIIILLWTTSYTVWCYGGGWIVIGILWTSGTIIVLSGCGINTGLSNTYLIIFLSGGG